jgi:hypothetical protein
MSAPPFPGTLSSISTRRLRVAGGAVPHAGHQDLRVAERTWPQYYTDDYLRTRKRRMVTAPCRVLSSGSRSILARPEEE